MNNNNNTTQNHLNNSIKLVRDKYNKPKYKKIKGITGVIKVFDQNLSDKYDNQSRAIIREKLGDNIIDNPDKYGEDIIVLTDDIPYQYIELQVFGLWNNDKFPYDFPFIYERKMKFRGSTLFICFNATYDKLIMFSKSAIHPKKYKIKKYSREYIHYVPWSKTMTLNTIELSIQSIRLYTGDLD